MLPPDLHVSDRWKLRSKTLFVGRIPLLMGIINVTPDSFSDGGKYFDPDKAVEHGLKLVGEGADILDIGGQSTRPGAERISVDEELRRVMPVVSELCRLTSVPISIDTFQPGVAEEAVISRCGDNQRHYGLRRSGNAQAGRFQRMRRLCNAHARQSANHAKCSVV